MRRKGIFYLFCFCFVVLSVLGVNLMALAQEPALPKGDISSALESFSQMDAGNKNMILSAAGLPQTNDLDVGKMAAYLIFGSIGFVAFVYGKKNVAWRPMVIGAALIACPYFVSTTLFIYLVGIVLTVALYFWRE